MQQQLGRPSPKRRPHIVRTLTFVAFREWVLLIKGAPTKRLWANKYNGLGGHVEDGETIIDAAIREVHEESGIQPDGPPTLRVVVSIGSDDDDVHILMFVFRMDVSSKVSVTPSEEGELEWLRWQSIDPAAAVEDLPLLLPHVMDDTKTGVLFARYWYDEAGSLQTDFRDPEGSHKP